MGDHEEKTLSVLASHYHEDGRYLYFRYIATLTDLEIKQVRRAVRSLARRGFAEYMRGLFDEDGKVAGSGYACTTEGLRAHEALFPRAPIAEIPA